MNLNQSWRLNASESKLNRLYDYLRRRVNAHLVRFLTPHLPGRGAGRGCGTMDRKGCRVLEAGSGTAFASSLFRDQPGVRSAVCLDSDAEALRLAKQRDPGLLAVVGDLRRMPFSDGTFSLVFNSSTVEHLDDPCAGVMEMQRVCGPEGRVFVGVPYRFGPLAIQPLIRRTKIGVWLGPVFGRASFDRLLRGGRLHPVQHIRYFGLFFIGAVAEKSK